MASGKCVRRIYTVIGRAHSNILGTLETRTTVTGICMSTQNVWNYRKCSTMPAPSDPPECLLRPMNFPMKTLMGPGPSNCPPRVLHASSLPMLGHLHPEFTQIMDEVKEGIKYIFQTKNDWTVCVSGTGHAAMEASVCNIIEPGDKVLVCTNGIWGERFAEMADRHEADVKQITTPMGTTFTLEQIEKALEATRPAVVFITQGESSGTALQPLEGVGALCHRYNALLIVDSVAACGGVPLYMDEWVYRDWLGCCKNHKEQNTMALEEMDKRSSTMYDVISSSASTKININNKVLMNKTHKIDE